MEYREMKISEADRISEIDAKCYIKNAWRWNNDTKQYELVEINWMDYELPNGYEWHLGRFKDIIKKGGKAFGCYDEDKLVGYGTVGSKVFGKTEKYILLDQLFVSKSYRNKGIGKKLFLMCATTAKGYGATKIYLCAGSSEDTIAFYRKLGCISAGEIDKELFEEDPNDIQLEYFI